VNVNCQDDATTSGFPKGDVHEMTTIFGFFAHTSQEKHLLLEVIDFHLIFDLVFLLLQVRIKLKLS
jgi:hypothetical protein